MQKNKFYSEKISITNSGQELPGREICSKHIEWAFSKYVPLIFYKKCFSFFLWIFTLYQYNLKLNSPSPGGEMSKYTKLKKKFTDTSLFPGKPPTP